MPLAGRLALGHDVAPDAQLLFERGGQTIDQGERRSRPGRARVATRTARRTSGRAKNRSPRTWNGIPAAPSAPSIGGQLGVGPDEDRHRAMGGAGLGERPDRRP